MIRSFEAATGLRARVIQWNGVIFLGSPGPDDATDKTDKDNNRDKAGVNHFLPGVPSNFFSISVQQSM